jgi:hypothetical protein
MTLATRNLRTIEPQPRLISSLFARSIPRNSTLSPIQRTNPLSIPLIDFNEGTFFLSSVMRYSRKKTSPVRARNRKRTPARDSTSILDLVRDGVEKFILKDANILAFQRAVLAASKGGRDSTNPLTRAAFRRIVKEATRKRKMRMTKSNDGYLSTGGKKST